MLLSYRTVSASPTLLGASHGYLSANLCMRMVRDDHVLYIVVFMRIGLRSMISQTIWVSAFFIAMIIIMWRPAFTKDVIIAFVVFNALVAFSVYKLFYIENEHLVIVSVGNPFRFKRVLRFAEIDYLRIRPGSAATVLYFFLKNGKELRVECSISDKEQTLLADSLTKKGVVVDDFHFTRF